MSDLAHGTQEAQEQAIQGTSNWHLIYKRLKKNKTALIGGYLILIFIIVVLIGPLFTVHDPLRVDYSTRLLPPSSDFWLGTDHNGRDIFTRLIHGMSITLYIGFLSVFVGMVIGVPMGILSGYYGKLLDTIIMRIVDVLLAFPGILLAIALVSVLGGSINNVIVAVGIFSIPGFARIVRGTTMAVSKLEYIEAVRALGASDLRIIFLHILPNIVSPIIVQATIRIAIAILIASGLSFLGLGAQPPTPEWGAMLSQGRSYMFDHPYVALFPGLAIVSVVLAFNLFGDGLRDAFDPRTRV